MLTSIACGQSEAMTEDPIRTCLDPDIEPTAVPDFPLVYETEHLDIYIEDDQQFLCAGSALDYERHAVYVAEQLGVTLQRRIPFYLTEFVTDLCPSTGGCIKPDGVVFSRVYSSHHELAHAVACERRFLAPPVLEEGLAVSFEPLANDIRGEPETFSEISDNDAYQHYNTAGHFVRWLHRELGPETFMDLYASANYDDGVWSAIEASYATLTSNDIATDYETNAPLMWIPHRQCADLPLLEPDADGTWRFEATFDCDDPSTLGPYERVPATQAYPGAAYDMYQSFLIDVEAPGPYRLERADFLELGVTNVNMERCLDEHPMTEAEVESEVSNGIVWFNFMDVGTTELSHPGLWRVDVSHDHGPPVDLWVTIAPDPG